MKVTLIVGLPRNCSSVFPEPVNDFCPTSASSLTRTTLIPRFTKAPNPGGTRDRGYGGRRVPLGDQPARDGAYWKRPRRRSAIGGDGHETKDGSAAARAAH